MTGENGELRHVKLNAATESRWSLCVVWRGGAASRGVTLGCEAAVREDLAHASLLAQEAQRGQGPARPPLSCGLRASLPPPSLGRESRQEGAVTCFEPAGRNAATAMGGVPSSGTRENPFIRGLQEHVLHAHRASSPLRVL